MLFRSPYMRAKEFIDHYFESFKGVKKYIEATIEEAKEKGFVETLYGRRRYLPEINSSVMQVRKAAERMAVNTPLQGTAADIIKIAMIHVAKWLETSGVNARLLMQVHDELVLEVEEKALEEVTKNISHLMSSAAKLDVPLLVESGTGHNWDEAH